jgi:hypothetical protein
MTYGYSQQWIYVLVFYPLAWFARLPALTFV